MFILYQIIKPIFQISQFNNLPPSCFLAASNLFKISKFQAGEVVVQYNNKESDPYFIMDGFLYNHTKDKQIPIKVCYIHQKLVSWWKRSKDDYINNTLKVDQEKINYFYPPGSIAGSFHKLDGKIWEAADIIALEHVQLITFSMKEIENIMRVVASLGNCHLFTVH